MKFKILIILCTTFFFLTSYAQKKVYKSITENDLKAHLEFVASDYMLGRDFGTSTPGLEITADYLKAQIEKLGLKPGGENYFQKVPMVSIQPDLKNSFLLLKDSEGRESFKTSDFFSMSFAAKNDTLEGGIVFAGYGWSDSENGYNDFEGVDVKDKLVLVMTRTREAALDTSFQKMNTMLEMGKLGRAVKAGAKGVLFVMDPMNPDKKWFDMLQGYFSRGMYSLEGKNQMSFSGPGKLIFITTQTANEILKSKGKTLEQLQEEINKTGKPNSFAIENSKVMVQLIKNKKSIDGKNVIGIIEGSDPELKNECVVFTAHYDHVGVNQNGEVANGADDNGSGTVSLLEIAEAFTKLSKHPKRSVVFVWVTAEEKGLFGSDHYTQNPVFPLNKTLTDINLDMVGRSAPKELEKVENENKSLAGPNGFYIISGKQSTELVNISNKYCRKLNLIPSDALTKAFLQQSDYYHFHKNGIPVIGVSTGLHEDYHQINDKVDKIDYTKMKRIAQFCFLVGYDVANKSERIVIDKTQKKQN